MKRTNRKKDFLQNLQRKLHEKQKSRPQAIGGKIFGAQTEEFDSIRAKIKYRFLVHGIFWVNYLIMR